MVTTLRLKVKPTKPITAITLTVVISTPTPVQVFQEQPFCSSMLHIIACMILALAGSLELFLFDRALLGLHHLKQALIIVIRLLNPSHESTLPNHDLYDEDPGSCGDPNSLLLLSLTSFTIFPLYTWTTQLILVTSWYAIRTECRLRPSFPPPAMHLKTLEVIHLQVIVSNSGRVGVFYCHQAFFQTLLQENSYK